MKKVVMCCEIPKKRPKSYNWSYLGAYKGRMRRDFFKRGVLVPQSEAYRVYKEGRA